MLYQSVFFSSGQLPDLEGLWGWGFSETTRRLPNGADASVLSPLQIQEGVIRGFGVGENHTIYIDGNGTMYGMGQNETGQLGIEDGAAATEGPLQIGVGGDWQDTQCGYRNTSALNTNGEIWSTGNNLSGRLGVGDTTDRALFTKIPGNTWASMTSNSASTFYGFKSDQTLWIWGWEAGRVGYGLPSGNDQSTPVQELTGNTWTMVSPGTWHVLAIATDGTLWGAGLNNYYQLGLPSTGTIYSTFTQLSASTDWVHVRAMGHASTAMNASGEVWIVGNLFIGSNTTWTLYQSSVESYTPYSIGGTYGITVVKTDGTLYHQNPFDTGQVGTDTNWVSVEAPRDMGTRAVFASKANAMYSKGDNQGGNLGVGDATERSTFTKMKGGAAKPPTRLEGNWDVVLYYREPA